MKTYKEFRQELIDEGFMDWWNKGRNERVPNENTAKFGSVKQYMPGAKVDKSTLFGDDVSQVTRSDRAFKSGSTGYKGWNPFKAFTPNMVRTGPTPAIRQAVERPIRALRSGLQSITSPGRNSGGSRSSGSRSSGGRSSSGRGGRGGGGFSSPETLTYGQSDRFDPSRHGGV